MRIYKRFFILIVFFGVFLARDAYPQDSANHNSRDITIVRLKVGMVTEAEFPDNIANVTKSISSESLEIETLGKRMFLLPREILDSYIYAVTQNNVSYCLHLIIDEAEAVTHVNIKKPVSSQNKEEKDKDTANTIELMKGLIAGKPLHDGASPKQQSKEIFNDKRVRITIDEVYELGLSTKAFILTFENLTSKPIVVPIEHMELPGLLAISVDSQLLEARHDDTNKRRKGFTTKAYMIVKGLNQ